jgi:hypothetical protein
LTPGPWLLRAQNAQTWAASALIGLKPTSAQFCRAWRGFVTLVAV